MIYKGEHKGSLDYLDSLRIQATWHHLYDFFYSFLCPVRRRLELGLCFDGLNCYDSLPGDMWLVLPGLPTPKFDFFSREAKNLHFSLNTRLVSL